MTKRVLQLWALVIVLVLLAAVLVITVNATDPSPQSVDGVKLYDVAINGRAYGDDARITFYPNEWGIVDLYFTAALSETGVSLLDVQHSPDGTNAWVSYGSIYTYTAATAPAFTHVRIPVYGQAIGIYMTIDGEDTTPEIYAVAKDTAGQ